MISHNQFASRLEQNLKDLPGSKAQELMAPEHRLPHEQWERYYARARQGGVLVLFYPHKETFSTVLIQRPIYKGVHSGQVGFPGGAREEGDTDLIQTALREAHEEIGVVQNSIVVLGSLTQLYIPPSNFLITPVVAFAEQKPVFTPDPVEVVELVETTIEELLRDEARSQKAITVAEGLEIQAPYFDIRGRCVWGATAMIISELNEVLKRTL